jgi:hypothetical protein
LRRWRDILGVPKRIFDMYTDHGATIVFRNSSSPLWKAISKWLRRVLKRVSDGRETARHQGVVSKLPPHLRYDTGELDCVPPPASLRQIQRLYQDALEAQWQRGI